MRKPISLRARTTVPKVLIRTRLALIVGSIAALALASPAAAQDYGSTCAAGTICISDVSVMEGNAGTVTATFTVAFQGTPTRSYNLTYQTMDAEGTATPNTDYTPISNPVAFTISPAQPSVQVAVTVVGDTALEPNEAFFVHVAGSVDVSKHHGTGTIMDDDGGGGGAPGGGYGPDTTPPNTFIHGGPRARTRARRASFHLASTEPGSRFQCKLDARPWRACRANLTLRRLSLGLHTLRVRAIDAAGNVDRTPARRSWRVIR
jgi:hypothetical protein